MLIPYIIILGNTCDRTRINEEARILAIIPEKLSRKINDIVPQIAEKVETIHSSRMSEVSEQFKNFQQSILDEAKSHQARLNITYQEVSQKLTEVYSNFKQECTYQMNEFTKEAKELRIINRKAFFKILSVMLIFSAVTSAVTAYVVSIRFPKYMKIEGAHDVSIHNSQIDMWGSHVNGEPKNNKNKK